MVSVVVNFTLLWYTGVDSWSTFRVLTPEPIHNTKYLAKMYRWKFSSGGIAPELLQESQDEKSFAVRGWIGGLEEFFRCKWASLMGVAAAQCFGTIVLLIWSFCYLCFSPNFHVSPLNIRLLLIDFMWFSSSHNPIFMNIVYGSFRVCVIHTCVPPPWEYVDDASFSSVGICPQHQLLLHQWIK